MSNPADDYRKIVQNMRSGKMGADLRPELSEFDTGWNKGKDDCVMKVQDLVTDFDKAFDLMNVDEEIRDAVRHALGKAMSVCRKGLK